MQNKIIETWEQESEKISEKRNTLAGGVDRKIDPLQMQRHLPDSWRATRLPCCPSQPPPGPGQGEREKGFSWGVLSRKGEGV